MTGTTDIAARPPAALTAIATLAADEGGPGRALPRWPLVLIALPAAVAVWSGWVGLGTLCGFGVVHPLPGIASGLTVNTAITLPVGVEAYGAYAMGAWLHPATPPGVRKFARNSALGALALGMAGQVIYHLLTAAHAVAAPWPVVVLVSCLPVLTLGFGGGLAHLLRSAHATAPAATTMADVAPAAPADTGPDIAADNGADTAPAPRHAPTRPRRAPSTATRVAALRARHPGMTAADIAVRLKVSDRTVRRYLSKPDVPQPLAA